jgi:glycosyltransferase involved in cell wall biosynthesis
MRIAFDTTGLEVDQSGAARSIAAVREALRADPRVDLVELGQPTKRPAGGLARGLVRELAWYPVQLPDAVRRSGAALLHCPGPLGPPRRIATPTVVTLNDVMPLDHPEWFTRVNTWHTRVLVRRLATLAAAVLVPSEFSRQEVTAAWDIDPARIHVTPYGVDDRFSPGPPDEELLARLGVEAPYLLTVGRLQPRKNLDAAIDAFGRLVAAGLPHRLVVVGARGWRDEALLERVRTAGVADRIQLTGRITDEELIGLYRAAACFVFPSRFEGFGFPPLEAMACGAPVVSSDRTSMPEVVGDAGMLVDPEDTAALAEAIGAVVGSPQRAAELRERGLRRAVGFTWAACADATVRAYEAALR